MSLPINIKELVNGRSVEWERLEFKRGWNPEEVVRTICVFANDVHNWGGGYIIAGIEGQNGKPVLPPEGLKQSKLDAIQKEVFKLGHIIQPAYIPIMQPYVLDGRHILVLWCPAGDLRPYSAPSTLGTKAQRHYYLRSGSVTSVARDDTLRQMFEIAARVPFDDRINQEATIDDFDLALIQAYLHEVKSDLFEESKRISLTDLTRKMHIAKGSDEYLRPVNVGLMFFSRTPEKYFERAWIEVVRHRDDIGDNFTEHYFKGALQVQLREALQFIKTDIINELIRKVPNQAEALRLYNYPYDAVEEALSNAVYHKGYDSGKPIEVQIHLDRITVLSFPGPVPPVGHQILKGQIIVARDYRNRRIGDFLKELELTEGRGTGFPKMFHTMESNGSPQPLIETDESGNYFLVTLPINPLYVKAASAEEREAELNGTDLVTDQDANQVSNQVTDQVTDQVLRVVEKQLHNKVWLIIAFLFDWTAREEIFSKLEMTNHTLNKRKYLDPLINIGLVEMEYPDKRTSPKQRYRTTETGRKFLTLIKRR